MSKKINQYFGTISMERFLRDYCGIDELRIENLSTLSHKRLKEFRTFYPMIKTVPYEAATDEATNKGIIIYVKDKFGNVATYKNPRVENFNHIIEDSPRINPNEIVGITDEEYIDIIEENMTLPDVKIKSIGSHTLKRGR